MVVIALPRLRSIRARLDHLAQTRPHLLGNSTPDEWIHTLEQSSMPDTYSLNEVMNW